MWRCSQSRKRNPKIVLDKQHESRYTDGNWRALEATMALFLVRIIGESDETYVEADDYAAAVARWHQWASKLPGYTGQERPSLHLVTEGSVVR